MRTFGFVLFALAAAPLGAETVSVRLLATTDLHGNLYPYDYFTARPAPRGLAKIATLIARERNADTLLVDCGDTIQGTPLEALYQTWVSTGRLPLDLKLPAAFPKVDPMMAAMNLLHYDAMVLGNHEFNYGLRNLDQARSQAKFPWLSANTRVVEGSDAEPFPSYVVKTAGGVKVAVIGITTPGIPAWEKPENYHGYHFEDGVEAARRAVEELRQREHPDLIIVAAHSGLDRNPKTGAVESQDLPGENVAYQIATQVEGVDAVVFAHTHRELAEWQVGKVLLMQPRNWGMSLGEMDFTCERPASGGPWRLVAKSSRVIPVTAETPADPRILEIAKPYHEAAERYLETPVAQARVAIDGSLARVEDTAILDAVETVELHYAKADVSFASSFNPRARIPAGQVTVRQIAALYIYDNTLYAVDGTGRMVREALENSARYFLQCSGDCSQGPLINREFFGFNYDMAEGVSYEIDLRQPAGSRIRNLTFRGRPLSDDEKLRIAVNNYRAGGSGGYTMFRGAKIVWRSTDDIRDLIVRYYIEHKTLPDRPDDNWKIVPEAARKELEREAVAQTRRTAEK